MEEFTEECSEDEDSLAGALEGGALGPVSEAYPPPPPPPFLPSSALPSPGESASELELELEELLMLE